MILLFSWFYKFYKAKSRKFTYSSLDGAVGRLLLKIAIEQEGGIWAKGESGHSSGTGIQRDMDKNNLAIANGWVIIRRTPDQMCTKETIELIRAVKEASLGKRIKA